MERTARNNRLAGAPGILPSLLWAGLLCGSAAWAQTTVSSTERQAKASDFAPIPLPVPDPALLQSTVSASRPAPVKPVIELQYDPTPDLVYPHDSTLTRWVTVKNNGGYTELQFDAVVNGPGGFTTPAVWFPQPPLLYLQPNESQRIWILVNWTDLNRAAWVAGGVYDYRIDIRVAPKANGQSAAEIQAQTQTASLHNMVHVVYTAPPVPTGQPMADNNATITGQVYDAATGKPLANTWVQLISSTESPFRPATDGAGHYSVPVTAYWLPQKKVWADFGVTIRATGYADFHTAVAPHAGDTVRIDAPMTPAVPGPSYAVTAKVDAVLNQYRGEGSQDGKYFALAPFHSIAPPGVDRLSYIAQAKLWFFSTGGGSLWQFPLYAETPAVAVSDDGSLVATARCNTTRSDNGVYLLNNAGQVVWAAGNLGSRAQNGFYEVRFSHDKKYLAAGDGDGNLYLLDIASRKTVWQRFLNGQVRTLVFEGDDATLYAGSGDGYLYSLRMDGTLLWRTYAGGWSTVFSLSKNYILISGKEGYYMSLLDRATGKMLWQYPVVQAGMQGAIAEDESYVLIAGTGAGFGTLMLDSKGVLLYHEDPTGAGAIARGGSSLLLTGQDIAPDDTGTTWLKLIGRDGRELWNSGRLDQTRHRGPLDGYVWMSDDGRKAVAANGNWVYFLTQQGPGVNYGGIASAASYSSSGTNGIAPGEMLTLFGQGLGPAQLTTLQLDGTGKVATLLAGTRVLLDTTPGPIIYTSSGQVSVMAPYDIADKSKVTMTVQYEGRASLPIEVGVVAANPALFTLDSSGKGAAAIVHADGTPVDAAKPAAAGETVILFAAGYGTSVPALPDGAVVGSVLPAPALNTQLLIDGQAVATEYCGAAPSLVNGLLQVNFRVPALAAGAHQIQLQVGERKSPAGVTVQIQ